MSRSSARTKLLDACSAWRHASRRASSSTTPPSASVPSITSRPSTPSHRGGCCAARPASARPVPASGRSWPDSSRAIPAASRSILDEICIAPPFADTVVSKQSGTFQSDYGNICGSSTTQSVRSRSLALLIHLPYNSYEFTTEAALRQTSLCQRRAASGAGKPARPVILGGTAGAGIANGPGMAGAGRGRAHCTAGPSPDGNAWPDSSVRTPGPERLPCRCSRRTSARACCRTGAPGCRREWPRRQ